jgi:hypothetical protein
MNARDDIENIHAEEQEILERFREGTEKGPFSFIDSVELVGTYPETVIRMTGTRYGRIQVQEWSLWDGDMTGSPPGVGSGPDEYLQKLGLQVTYWMTSPQWRAAT